MLTRTYRLPGLTVEEHRVTVPLDHFGTTGGELEVFARVYVAGRGQGDGQRERSGQSDGQREVATTSAKKPYLLYLQGGPGFEAARVTRDNPGWVARALKDYNVVMLDQRGTGESTPVGFVDGRFHGTGGSQDPEAVAAYLTHFRADAIVEDAEVVRASLGIDRWAVLGQSFGGFTALRYLAEHPSSLERVLFTGGLPRVVDLNAEVGAGLVADVAQVYAATWAGVAVKSERFFARFPDARVRYVRWYEQARGGGIELADGTVAGEAHVRGLGHLLGASGGAERLHYLLAMGDTVAGRADLLGALTFSARNPLYVVLHESCWASGVVTRWGAERARPGEQAATALAGEHISPAHFESGPLAVWKDVAHLLAQHEWPVMWDVDKLRGAGERVPAVAAVYFEDAYVPAQFSLATAELAGIRTWVTNEYEHDGLRASGERVLDRLLAMSHGDA